MANSNIDPLIPDVQKLEKGSALSSATAGSTGYVIFDFSELLGRKVIGIIGYVNHYGSTRVICNPSPFNTSDGSASINWYATQTFNDSGNQVRALVYYI